MHNNHRKIETKKASLFLIAAVMTAMIMTSCGSNSGVLEQTASGEKGNQTASLKKVGIESRVWMAENPNVDKIRNADPSHQG